MHTRAVLVHAYVSKNFCYVISFCEIVIKYLVQIHK